MSRKIKKCPWTITLQRIKGIMPPSSFVISPTKGSKIIEWIQLEIKNSNRVSGKFQITRIFLLDNKNITHFFCNPDVTLGGNKK